MIARMFILALLTCFLATPLLAQGSPITVRAASDGVPARAIGLVFSDNGVLQTPDTEIERLREGEYLITFAPRRMRQVLGETRGSLRASAIIENEDGSIVHANVTHLKAAGEDHPLSGPLCELRTSISSGVQSQSSGIFHQLIKLREDKRQNHLAELGRKITPELQYKIKRLEENFGLSEGTEISASLEPYVLIQRLARLQNAITLLKANKPRPAEEQETN
jgi:hypothetical protein